MEKTKNNTFAASLPALFSSVALFFATFLWAFFRDRANGVALSYTKLLSDAAATTGLGFLTAHLFSFIRRNGGFTAFSYALRFVKNAFLAPTKRQERYADYREKQTADKRKSPACFWLVGLCYLLLSFVFI